MRGRGEKGEQVRVKSEESEPFGGLGREWDRQRAYHLQERARSGWHRIIKTLKEKCRRLLIGFVRDEKWQQSNTNSTKAGRLLHVELGPFMLSLSLACPPARQRVPFPPKKSEPASPCSSMSPASLVPSIVPLSTFMYSTYLDLSLCVSLSRVHS